MTARSFTVETRSQAVCIFGGPSRLTSELIKGFIDQGIHAAKISTVDELNQLRHTHDPDYLLIFLEPDIATWLAGEGDELVVTLTNLIESGESRLIVASPFSSSDFTLSLGPVSKHLHYSDYVGSSELNSPLIESWIAGIRDHHVLEVPGDGLTELSLLAQSDLVNLFLKAVLHPSSSHEDVLYLGNPEPISFLNLAYLLRSSLPFKVNLSFNQDASVVVWPYDEGLIQKTLNKLDYRPLALPEEQLTSYFKKHVKLFDPGLTALTKLPAQPTRPPVVKSVIESEAEALIEEPPLSPPVKPPIPRQVVSRPAPVLPSREVEDSPLPPLKKLTPLKTAQPVFVPLQTERKKIDFSLKLKRRPKVKHSGPLRLPAILGRGLIIALALYLGTLAFSATITALSLNQIFKSLNSGSLPRISSLSAFTSTYLRANWLALTSVPPLSRHQTVTDLSLILDAYGQSLSAFKTAGELSQSTSDLTHYIFGTGNADITKVVSLSRLQAEELYQKLSLLDGTLPAEPPGVLPDKHTARYLEAKAQLQKLRISVTTTKALLATAPDVIGLGGRRKYGVLFQNNMELRPTGGFIGSFAILSFENGKLYDMPIYDVYDADGQLKGHVEPPAPIKDILGEANWYLRDSNFDPDFPTSARRAEWFIKKSLNQDLDGTIAINVNTLVGVLKATGPLQVPDYNETITDSNLYERAQFHAEVNFFPGSTQKKEFLSTVANTLFAKLPQLGAGEGLKLVAALGDSVQQKDTLISLLNPTTEHVFETLGWNGKLNDLPCPSTSSCHKDYAMVVDSNFGVNKANYFIKRDLEEVITFDKNLAVNHVLRLNYHNTSTSTAWPAGAYKNYQRLYLPPGANLSRVKVGETTLTDKDYVISTEHNKVIIAYLVTVPISSTVVVEVEYSTPQLSQENDLLYTWYWQKQPGTSASDKLVVYLNYPLFLKPVVISPQSELAPQQLKFNLSNDTDRRLTVKFSK
jgi:hypothetical protein